MTEVVGVVSTVALYLLLTFFLLNVFVTIRSGTMV